MADRMRLTPHDMAMIHALGVLSRPSIHHEGRKNLDMVVSILRDVLPGVARENTRLRPLVQIADMFVGQRPNAPGCYGGLHDAAWRAMNDWDGQRLGDAWDHIRGAS